MSASSDPVAKVRDSLAETDTSGRFMRKDSVWRSWIKEDDPDFPPEANRYHLYVSHACPWANRCHCILKMKGLDDVIGVSVVHPTWQFTRKGEDDHAGWAFADPNGPPVTNQNGHGSFPCDGCVPDTVNIAKYVRDLYDIAGCTNHKFTVPVLWDKKKQTIVNNESSEIVVMLDRAFNKLAKNPHVSLSPEDLEKEMADVESWIYPNINNGVYRCGFAKTQDAYEEAYNQLFSHLDKAEELLSKQRYLCGDRFTASDLKLYMTLVRFDPVYVVYFKCYGKRIDEYPNLWNYTKEIYQMPEVKAITNMYHIKTHYFTSHPILNPYAIIPARKVPDMDAPHDRNRFNK